MASPETTQVANPLGDNRDDGIGLEILPPKARGKLKPAIKLKLFVDRVHQKVAFAVVGKDAVDVLFSILGLPLGSIVGLIGRQSMVGCLDKLYHSLKSLDKFYVQTNQKRTDLLTPKVASLAVFSNAAVRIWKCSNKMETRMVYDPPPTGGKEGTSTTGAEEVGGFVKGPMTYIVMDDLEVSPESYYPDCTLFNNLDIKDINSLKELTVDLNMSKAREMLMVSLHSTTVLTDIFLPNKLKRCHSESV